mgnify:CR=1 FL=1
MKEEGHEHWIYYSDEITEETTNESGFTGLPAGYRHEYNGGCYNVDYGYFWSATTINSSTAWRRNLNYYNSVVFRDDGNKRTGFSIRCLEN